MKTLSTIALLAGALTLEACAPAAKQPDQVFIDGGHPEACEGACAKLLALHCPEAATTPGGVTCLEVCQRAENSGKLSVYPDCVAHAATREELAVCNVRCEQAAR